MGYIPIYSRVSDFQLNFLPVYTAIITNKFSLTHCIVFDACFDSKLYNFGHDVYAADALASLFPLLVATTTQTAAQPDRLPRTWCMFWSWRRLRSKHTKFNQVLAHNGRPPRSQHSTQPKHFRLYFRFLSPPPHQPPPSLQSHAYFDISVHLLQNRP